MKIYFYKKKYIENNLQSLYNKINRLMKRGR